MLCSNVSVVVAGVFYDVSLVGCRESVTRSVTGAVDVSFLLTVSMSVTVCGCWLDRCSGEVQCLLLTE